MLLLGIKLVFIAICIMFVFLCKMFIETICTTFDKDIFNSHHQLKRICWFLIKNVSRSPVIVFPRVKSVTVQLLIRTFAIKLVLGLKKQELVENQENRLFKLRIFPLGGGVHVTNFFFLKWFIFYLQALVKFGGPIL